MKFSAIIFPNDKNPNHSKALDGLRGLAVLIVILSHLSNNNILLFDFLNFSTIGKYGVYLFFVLSSYLLDKQIIRALISNKASLKYWLNYSLRRFLRIIPLFTIALFINYILTKKGVSWAIQLNSEELLKHLTFQQGKDIFWSIPVEFKYYLASPLLMYFTYKYLNWSFFKIIILLMFLIITSIVLTIVFHLNELSLIKYLPLFLFGSLVAIIEETQPKITFQFNRYRQLVDYLGVFCLTIILILTPFYFNIIFQTNIKHFHHSLLFSFFALIWSIVLIAVLFSKNLISFLFESKFLRFFGSLSFSLYLFHVPILTFFNEQNYNSVSKFFSTLIVSVLISLVSFIFIEKPLSKVKLI